VSFLLTVAIIIVTSLMDHRLDATPNKQSGKDGKRALTGLEREN